MMSTEILSSEIKMPDKDEITKAIKRMNDKRSMYCGCTVGQIYNTMDDVQKVIMWYLISKIVEEVQEDQNEDQTRDTLHY